MILTPLRARLVLAGLLAIVLFGVRISSSVPPAPRDPSSQIGDANLYLRMIERLRAGEPYYLVVGEELRRHHYPTIPIFNWRTPLHYELVVTLSVKHAGTLLSALAIAVVASGLLAYGDYSVMKSLTAPLLLLGAVLPALLVRPDAVAMAEIWSGVFIGLSLNAYISRRWILGALLGIIAIFLRELAVPYGVACGLLALRDRRWREFQVWTIGGLGYIIYYTIHAVYASAAIQPTDIRHAESWIQWAGLGFLLRTLHTFGWLTIQPPVLTAVAAGIGLASLFARSAPIHLRLALAIYAVLFSIIGQRFNYYWGYVTCVVWAHAFVFSAEGLSNLARAAWPASTAQHNQARA
jgi:hypothetical protein